MTADVNIWRLIYPILNVDCVEYCPRSQKKIGVVVAFVVVVGGGDGIVVRTRSSP